MIKGLGGANPLNPHPPKSSPMGSVNMGILWEFQQVFLWVYGGYGNCNPTRRQPCLLHLMTGTLFFACCTRTCVSNWFAIFACRHYSPSKSGLLLWARPRREELSIDCCTVGAAAARVAGRRASANAGSATLIADVWKLNTHC